MKGDRKKDAEKTGIQNINRRTLAARRFSSSSVEQIQHSVRFLLQHRAFVVAAVRGLLAIAGTLLVKVELEDVPLFLLVDIDMEAGIAAGSQHAHIAVMEGDVASGAHEGDDIGSQARFLDGNFHEGYLMVLSDIGIIR